ncbi:hypothetical protein VPH35_056149 [Triticum aestivum]
MRPKSVANLLRPRSLVAGCASANLSPAPFAILAGFPNKEQPPPRYGRQLRLYLRRVAVKVPANVVNRSPSHPSMSAAPFHPGYRTPKKSLLQRRETKLDC